jgi:hypothetical protein
MACKIPFELVGRVFSTTLIILEGQGINVILGMNWMKMHRVVLDISARLVQLGSPICDKVSLQLPHVTHLLASVYAAIAKSLDEIHVVHEYSDVFPNDLPGMPLIGPSNSRLCCSRVLLLSISGHILWHEMR